MAHLIIVSSHNSTGAMINNTTTAADDKVLLPMVAVNIATCRPAGVRFVCLQLELDYTILSAGLSSRILKAMYYIELP